MSVGLLQPVEGAVFLAQCCIDLRQVKRDKRLLRRSETFQLLGKLITERCGSEDLLRSSLRKPDPLHEIRKSSVGADRVPDRIVFEIHHAPAVVFIGLLKPSEGILSVIECGVHERHRQ